MELRICTQITAATTNNKAVGRVIVIPLVVLVVLAVLLD